MRCFSNRDGHARTRLRGQSLVEFALVIPIVLLLLAGGSDLARAYFVGTQVADGARQAALYAADNPGAPTSDISAVAEHNTGSNGSGLAATVLDCPPSKLLVTVAPATPDASATGFDDQTVTVTCHLPLLTPLLPSPITISASAVGLVAVGVLSVASTGLPDAILNQAYTAQLVASDGTAPYTWTQLSGSLPPGLSMDSAGDITGTPTATGTYSFSVLVTDSTSPAAQTATATLSITVRQPLAITTTSLPDGTTGTSYSAPVAATGGATPYTWAITSGTLPAGLTLDAGTGVISGTPTGTGPSTFTVTVTDSTVPTPQTASQLYTVAVT